MTTVSNKLLVIQHYRSFVNAFLELFEYSVNETEEKNEKIFRIYSKS